MKLAIDSSAEAARVLPVDADSYGTYRGNMPVWLVPRCDDPLFVESGGKPTTPDIIFIPKLSGRPDVLAGLMNDEMNQAHTACVVGLKFTHDHRIPPHH